MSHFVDQVVDFNKRVLMIDQRNIDMLKANEFEISVKCLQEELDEFAEAFKSGDIIGCIDAIIDLKYFAVGVMYKMGLTPETMKQCMTAVHEANMEKKLGVVAKRAVEGVADAVKPEGWVSPEERIASILDAVK